MPESACAAAGPAAPAASPGPAAPAGVGAWEPTRAWAVGPAPGWAWHPRDSRLGTCAGRLVSPMMAEAVLTTWRSWDVAEDWVEVRVWVRVWVRPLRSVPIDCMEEDRLWLEEVRSASVWVPMVPALPVRVVETRSTMAWALARDSLTWDRASIVEVVSASWEPVSVRKAASMRPWTDGSVMSPVCTDRPNSGTLKSTASTTRRRSAVAPSCGGASSAAHWTWDLPSPVLLSTPLVTPWASEEAVMTLSGSASRETAADSVRGAPTSAVRVREVPATS